MIKGLDTLTFLKLIKEKASELGIDEKFYRQLNVGFFWRRKEKNEILQMKLLQPKLSILDETDSGLDIDALRIVADGVNSYKSKENAFNNYTLSKIIALYKTRLRPRPF